MRRTGLTALAVTVTALAVAGPAEAQRYRWDFGINGGGSWYSNSLDEDHLGIDADARFEAGWLVGAQLTYWVPSIFGWNDRLGIRANFAYTERPFELSNGGDVDLIEDVNLWSGTGDLLIRFSRPDPRGFRGIEWLPYLALGAGAKWIAPGVDNSILDGVDGAFFEIAGDDFVLEKTTKFMGLVGLGTDARLSRNFALRLEVGDRIWDSPIVRTDIGPDEDVGNVIHEIYGQLGLHLLFGVREERVAVVPPPPAPPPPPAEEAVSVCVIDPNTYEVSFINAIYVPSTRDTLVVVNGQRVDVSTAYPERAPLYVANARWYTAGEPLTFSIAGMETEWVTYGGARVINPQDLAFLGTVNGTPIYADADDVDDILDELEDLRDKEGDDLEDMLEERADLREELMELDVVYVPLESGCVFQPLRLVEEVRKVRG